MRAFRIVLVYTSEWRIRLPSNQSQIGSRSRTILGRHAEPYGPYSGPYGADR